MKLKEIGFSPTDCGESLVPIQLKKHGAPDTYNVWCPGFGGGDGRHTCKREGLKFVHSITIVSDH